MRPSVRVFAILLGCFCLAQSLDAQQCAHLVDSMRKAPTETTRLRVGTVVRGGCLGGVHDTVGGAATLDERLAPSAFESRTAQRHAAAIVLSALAMSADAAAEGLGAPHDSLRTWFDTLAGATQRLARTLGGTAADTALLNIERWRLQLETFSISVVSTSDLYEFGVQGPCAVGADPCAVAVDHSFRLLRHARIVERVVDLVVNLPATSALADSLAMFDDRWKAYFTDARSQLGWELWLNGRWYRAVKNERYCPSRGGFCEPPSRQWILLHPSLALEYVSGTAPGARVDESLVLELFGVNRWSWDKGAAMRNAVGASLVVSASDRSSLPTFGYGVLIHLRQTYSIGATMRGSRWGVVVSYDLWRRAEGEVQQARATFERDAR